MYLRLILWNVSLPAHLNVYSFTHWKCIFVYSVKLIFVYFFNSSVFTRLTWIFVYSVKMCLRLLCMTVFVTVLSEVPFCLEYCSTQTNNHNRFIRLKFYYIYTLLKMTYFTHYIFYYQCFRVTSIPRMLCF